MGSIPVGGTMLNNNMNILIAGDSWGMGEWGGNLPTYDVSHLGLERYFRTKKYAVLNVSKGGASNQESIRRLTFSQSYKKYDYIFWFQTSPLRNLRPYLTFKKDFRSYKDLLDKSNELLDKDYKNLNNLEQPIHCIGGCSKLNLESIAKYQNLIPLIPSITELILKDYKHPDIWLEEWNPLIGRQFDKNSIDLLYNDQNSINQLKELEEYRKYFWPDGEHPNRQGHKFLFKYICRTLNI
jgi:hypothetical protein